MATPLQGWTEWAPAATDGPAAVAVLARQIELGVVLRFASAAERDAAFVGASIDPDGSVARLATDPGALFVCVGAEWRRHGPDSETFASAAGVDTFDFAGTTAAETTVVFPAGRFSVAPAAQATVQDGSGSAFSVIVFTKAVTATQATFSASKATTVAGSLGMSWFAQAAG